MDKFEKHMAGSKTIELKNQSGEVDVFELQPLDYKFMPKIFQLVKNVTGASSNIKGMDLDADIDELDPEQLKQLFSLFDEETISLLGEIELETMRVSYPEQCKDDQGISKMKRFITSNMFNLFPVIIELNMPSLGDAKDMKKLAKEYKDNETKLEAKNKTFGKK